MSSVGILGLGTYLPGTVRTNDYWSPATIADWHHRAPARATRPDTPPADNLSSGVRRTLAGMAEYANDPFRGSVERRVMPDDMTTSDMEARAAREAIQRAGLRADQIDVILTQTPVPEYINLNGACITHRLLELPQRCLAINTNVACNGFLMHLSLAQGLIASGQARHVLSVHSSAFTRIMRNDEPDSPWLGDGASAAVIGPVPDGKGILSALHNTNGASCHALVIGVPNKRWWDDGKCTLYPLDRDHTRAMLLNLVDRAGEAITGALSAAHLAPRDVDFYAAHQGTAWLTRATAAEAGIEHAKTVVTFPQFGNLSSANIPLILAIAEREGMVRDGSVVVAFSGGTGETWSSVCLRWGR
jgi:3-oxoacyl-[acyl-carrier-protein] synthase-3